jgi:hypothetical protein
MVHQLLQRSFGSRQAGFLALLAVLLLASTPALEAAHDHDVGASYADCLYCKQAADLPIAAAPVVPAVAVRIADVDLPADAPALQAPCANYAPRGPPTLS